MLRSPFCRAFRRTASLGEQSWGFRLGFGEVRVFHEALGLSSPSFSCPQHLLGGIQERKDACGLVEEASWRCDWMKSHFPPVTQQATTELPDEERRRSTYLQAPSLLEIPLSIQPPSTLAHPCLAPGRRESVGTHG